MVRSCIDDTHIPIIAPSKMKLITLWNGRMPDVRVVRDICRNHHQWLNIQIIHNLFGHLHFVQIQIRQLFFFLLDFNIFYIQWCEKVLAPFLIFYFFACLPHFNVSDHQTNLNINQR